MNKEILLNLVAALSKYDFGLLAPVNRRRVAGKFRWHAEAWFAGESPLYERLSRSIARDSALLDLAGRSRHDQPIPYMFFGAVNLLLRNSPGDPLFAIYDAAGRGEAMDADPFPAFRRFCLAHESEIAAIISSHTVQSNIVSRSAALVAAWFEVSRRLEGRPFQHIEIGASAGLTMLATYYSYDFAGRQIGQADSDVKVSVECRGAGIPPFDRPFPELAAIIGNELEPIAFDNPQEMDWLESLIWPERNYYKRLHRAAVAVAHQYPPKIFGGDAIKRLPEMLKQLSPEVPVTIYHSHTLNQFPEKLKREFEALLLEQSHKYRILRIAFEGTASGTASALELFEYRNGERSYDLLARCHPHGRWIEWLAE